MTLLVYIAITKRYFSVVKIIKNTLLNKIEAEFLTSNIIILLKEILQQTLVLI